MSLTTQPHPTRDATGRDDDSRRRRLSRADRRAQLLDEAARLAVEQGVDAVTMEGVALGTGASKTLAYAYFANRTEILVELLERELGDLQRRALHRMQGATSVEHILRGAVGAWFDLVEERGALLGALLAAASVDTAFVDMRGEFLRGQEALYGGVMTDAFGVPAEDAAALAAILLAGLGGALERWVATGEPRHRYEDTYVAVVLAAAEHLGRGATGGRPT